MGSAYNGVEELFGNFAVVPAIGKDFIPRQYRPPFHAKQENGFPGKR
jgi:hypothetical protein